jgi:hypothetical protein
MGAHGCIRKRRILTNTSVFPGGHNKLCPALAGESVGSEFILTENLYPYLEIDAHQTRAYLRPQNLCPISEYTTRVVVVRRNIGKQAILKVSGHAGKV